MYHAVDAFVFCLFLPLLTRACDCTIAAPVKPSEFLPSHIQECHRYSARCRLAFASMFLRFILRTVIMATARSLFRPLNRRAMKGNRGRARHEFMCRSMFRLCPFYRTLC
jgi:hypothetical protein